MSNSEMFAQWILDNQDKQGTEDFNLVAQAFEKSLQDEQVSQQPEDKPFGFADMGEGAKEYGKSIVRGLGGSLLSAGSGLAELADVATDRIGLENLIDSGDENELIRLANSGQEFLQENFGVSDAYKDSWLTMFGEGVGSIGSFLIPGGALGAIGKGVGLAKGATKAAQTAAVIAQGSGVNVAEQTSRIEQSRARGVDVSEDQADASKFLAALVGVSEAFTPLNILKKIRFFRDPKTSNKAFDMVSSALKTGTIEGAQEVAASLMQDAIQMGIYDENIPVGESLWDEFTVGAAAGALVDAATTGMFRRRGGLSRDVERQREELIRQEEERQREKYFADLEIEEQAAIENEIQRQIAQQEMTALDEEQLNENISIFKTAMSEQYRAEQEAKLNEPYTASRGAKTVAQQGKEYAEQLSRNASIRSGLFPETGRFDIREELAGPQGTLFSVYNTADGKVYGQPTNDLEFAKHLTLGLNNEMVNRNVNRGIIEAMDLAPESYDPQTSETIYAVGQRLNRPKSYTISEATLNEAAGTVQTPDSPYLENLSLDQIHQIQYGVPPFQDGKKKLYKDMKNLTMSQQINLERARKGLPPLKEFTLAEAKDALGDKYDKVFDVLLDVQQPDMQKIREEFGEAGVNVQGGRQRYQDEVNTRREVETTLNNKNIISPINSKEIKYVFKKITGEQSIDKMSPSQRMYLVGELKKMPTLAKPAKLPDFTPRPYTRKDFDNAMSRVTSTGDGTLENIKEAMPEGLTERRKSTMANLIRAELLTRGVINKDGSVSELAALPDLRPAPTEKAPIVQPDFTVKQSEQAIAFESELNKKLKGMGLDDIRLKVLDQIREIGVTREGRAIEVAQKRDVSRAEGFFDQRSRTIVLSLDSAMQAARDNSPEAFDFALNDVLNHETVHALRNLDLWTQKEWSLLENAAKKVVVPGQGNKTFFQDASERYTDLSPVGRMEEAVAELIRYSKRDRSIIGGKPRTLIDRMFEFFRRMASAVKGTGFNTLNDLLDNIESGGLGARERGVVRTARATERLMGAVPARGIGRDIDMIDIPPRVAAPPADDTMQMSRVRIIGRNGTEVNQAPEGKTAHGLPTELLVDGPKEKARNIVVQNFTPKNTDKVLSSIQTVKSNNPDALGSTENWIAMEDDAFGGDFVPIPPLRAIQYTQSPELLAEKLKQLTPDLKAGVDEGFKYVQQIKNLYNTQQTSPDLTGRLFVWGLLSRGAGPVQQEFAFLNLLEAATPYIQKASEGKMTQADVINWRKVVEKSIPSGSPAKSVTMNANDIGRLLFELSKTPEGSNQTVMQSLHDMLADPNVSGREFRNKFFRLTNKPGVDNKVVSFIALVAGKDDVLVMDRIQSRHLWNDGRFGDKNIYDGFKKGKVKGGLNAILAGPRGLLVTESLEDGLSSVVQQAYGMIGRPQDASVGRMHWETWVIDGNQAVSHSTLASVATGSEIGGSVTEGKRSTYLSGVTYRQTTNGPIAEYPLSDGTVVRMTLDRLKEFKAFIENAKNGIIPKGFLVSKAKDRPWFELPEVNRERLDEAARQFENANPDGSIRSGDARSVQAGASDAGRRRAAARPAGSVEAPATDEISLSLKRLDGMPESFDVNGQAVEFGYFEPAVEAAKKYTARRGVDYEPLTEYAPVNEDVARKIAAEFELMEHAPDDPEVIASYNAMIEETKEQYRDVLDTGLKVQFIKGDDPYGNPRNAILDVINNNHLWVFPTVDGFGSNAEMDTSDNPLLQATEFATADGDPMLANDLFRVVHDYFGHIKNGVGFRARGEENAWQAHASMYSPLARRAMTTETRGQNSYVNFGPNRDFNLTANGADTVYADQKVGLLPLWVSEEARLSDPRRRDSRIFREGLQGAIRDDGKLSLTHFGRSKISRTDPKMAGRGLDRSRRYTPKGTYFGITEAIDDGYRKEQGLGPVENKFSVDPVLVYPLGKDHLGLIERHPAGNVDYQATIQNLKDNGFIGFWNNNPNFGKAAFIFEPLIADSAAPKIMGMDGDIQESRSRDARSPVPAYHMEEWTQKTGLSPREIENFWRLGDNQRGKPELLMVKAQKELGGGVLSYAIEHVGDLTNRMTPKHSVGFAYEESLSKAERVLRDLKSKYGFGREFEENLRDNASYAGTPLEDYRSKVNAALDAYADAHENLTVYNPLQKLARDAAVSLGRRDFDRAANLLQEFVDRIPTEADFIAEMQPSSRLNDIVESRRRVDNILSQEPEGSIARIYDEEVMRPILEEQQMRGTPFSWQAKSYSIGDKIVYQAADKLVGLKNAEEQINAARRAAGLPPIANKDSAYVGEESIPGKIGIEIKDFQENVQRPLARKIANNNLTIEEVDEFLTFRHAIERNNRIALRDQSRNVETNPGSGSLKTGDRLSNSFVKATMRRKYGLEWNDATETWEGGNERARRLLDVASDIDRITRQTTDRLVSGGLLSRENGEALKRLYKYYAPLKGKAQEDDLADLVAVSSGLNIKGKEYMRAHGRESAAESPLGHIMLNAERAISRAVKNQSFSERLVKLAKANPNEDFWEVYSEDDPRYKMAFDKYYTYIGSDPAMRSYQEVIRQIPQGMPSRDFIQAVTFNKDGLIKLDRKLIGAKINGKEYFVDIKDDRLRRAMQSVESGEAANALRKFSMVNRWLSMMNTSLNPEFVIGNFSRDLQTAIYNVIGEQTMTGGKIKDQKRIVRRILKDVIPSMGAVYKGMRRYDIKDGTLRGSAGMSQQDYNDFREFMESGAKADWFYNRPAEEQAQTIENMVDMERGTFTGNFRRRYENVRDFVEDANASVENAVRFAAFKAARDELLDSGVSRDEAVATASTLAKNLTVNFNRKGMQGDLLNSLFLFYNASVQGTLNFARGLNVFDPGSSRMKQGMVASMIGFGALMALKAEEESEENPDTGRSYYSEIPDYVKERNIVIMKENGKDYYTIPLPYGYNVFHLAGSKLYEMKSDLISPVKAASDLTSAFMGSFSPIGFFPLPTVTQPFWEIAKNENYFGSPIYKENFPTGTQVPESQLAMSTTRTPFKVAAKILNGLTGGNEYESGYIDVSPDALEHIAEFAFGGAGTFGLRNMNALEKWAKGEELETREMPFIRRIMGEPNEQMSMSDYYDRKVKLEQKQAALEGYRGAERLQYRNRNKDYITMFNLLDQSERQLRQLRKARSEIRTAAALSPANAKAYAEREEQIEDAIQKIYDRFNKYYDQRVGRTK